MKKSYKEDKKRAKVDEESTSKSSTSKPKADKDNALLVTHEEEMKKFKAKSNFPKKGSLNQTFSSDRNKFVYINFVFHLRFQGPQEKVSLWTCWTDLGKSFMLSKKEPKLKVKKSKITQVMKMKRVTSGKINIQLTCI